MKQKINLEEKVGNISIAEVDGKMANPTIDLDLNSGQRVVSANFEHVKKDSDAKTNVITHVYRYSVVIETSTLTWRNK